MDEAVRADERIVRATRKQARGEAAQILLCEIADCHRPLSVSFALALALVLILALRFGLLAFTACALRCC